MTTAIINSLDSSQDISAKIEQVPPHTSKITPFATYSSVTNQGNMLRRTNEETLHVLDANTGRRNNHTSDSTESNDIKIPITPRNSHTTLSLPFSDEPFQFDSDSRCASFRSLNSASEAENPDSVGPSTKINSTDENNKWSKDSAIPSILAPLATSADHIETQVYDKTEHAFSSPLDHDPSMGSSVSSSLNSTNAVRRTFPINPPSYVDSTSSSIVSPISYSIPAMQKSRVRSGRKVKPVVYSAIGSLESVNLNSLGSFNHRVTMAATLKKVKERKVKLDATTSRINKRLVQTIRSTSKDRSEFGVTGFSSTMEHSNNGNDKISTLSSTLESCIPNNEQLDKVVSQKGSDGTRSEAVVSNSTGDVDTKTKNQATIVPIIKNVDGSTLSQENKMRKRNPAKKKKVTIDSKPKEMRRIELFRPSCDAYTPRMGKKEIKYKPAELRVNMEGTVGSALGTIQKPNFNDALKRVAMIIQQHIVKIERRFESGNTDHLKLFDPTMRDAFSEVNFVTPRYKCTMVKLPMARAGIVCGMRKIRIDGGIPSADDIYEFGHRLFKQVQLSSECSIICLIYVERIMEIAKVPVMANTWKPIFMCGLLLASKVWQDWSSWNIEFANVYPQFSLESINKLELQFLKMVKWDLYISSSLYAKYYFALRSLLEKQDFRRRYATMVGGADHVSASQAVKISKRTELLKEKSLAFLSKSL
jgi:hypothetical protein